MATSRGQRSASTLASKAASGWHGTYYHTIDLINDMVVNTMATLEGQALLIADKLCKWNDSSNHLPKAQLRATLSPFQTAWTSFNPYLYSGGSSSTGSSLAESSKCNVFYTEQEHCDRRTGWCAVHSTSSRLLSARSVPCGRAYRPVGIDCKGTMP